MMMNPGNNLARSESKEILPMARRGPGTRGNKVPILTNHFKVDVNNVDGHFFHYNVALFYEDGNPVEGKGVGRKVIDKVRETYNTELGGKCFAYDGEKSLFSFGSLPQAKQEFLVVVDHVTSSRNSMHGDESGSKRLRRPCKSKTFKVEISFAARIPLQSIVNALRGHESENSQDVLRVFDIILRQNAARKGCLLVRQSFFLNEANNFGDVGGGVRSCRGFHSSFRTTQSGLSLNIDVSTTMTIRPGPVVDFLIDNQNVTNRFKVDWSKAKRTLKNLRITVSPTNQEYKITGLSEKSCREQLFTLKQRNNDGDVEVSVYDYFVNHKKMNLEFSANLPCINVGRPKRPTYIPIELCSLVSLQRYTKALTTFQRASLVEKSRQKPRERMSVLSDALRINNYGAEPMLRACGITITSKFTEVEGRILPTPRLKVGNDEDLFVRKGRWNFNNKKFANPCTIENWAVVNFSTSCNARRLIEDLKKVARAKGIAVHNELDVFEEDQRYSKAPAHVRVDKMFNEIKGRLSNNRPKFLLCLLSQRKNSDIYGPLKRITLSVFGIITQCSVPTRVNDQYLTNLLLKINAKLGGMSSVLAGHEVSRIVSKVPTLILGMDVSHGAPGQSESPSIAAVVSSRRWPSISHYRASVRTQSPRHEMIESLYRPISESRDDGIISELLLDFITTSAVNRKPEHIIIFRDGVSESQFNQVLNIELNQIMEACNFVDDKWRPKFVVLVAQKKHYTKFFLPNSSENVQPGTIIDNGVCHPKNYDFYLCAHDGMIGTSRPTHYHVLLDQVGFSPDELQQLVHSLSYVYQRSTTAISVVAPICYAHLAAAQLGQWMKFEEAAPPSETSSSHDAAPYVVPPMPELEESVRNTMFFFFMILQIFLLSIVVNHCF